MYGNICAQVELRTVCRVFDMKFFVKNGSTGVLVKCVVTCCMLVDEWL